MVEVVEEADDVGTMVCIVSGDDDDLIQKKVSSFLYSSREYLHIHVLNYSLQLLSITISSKSLTNSYELWLDILAV